MRKIITRGDWHYAISVLFIKPSYLKWNIIGTGSHQENNGSWKGIHECMETFCITEVALKIVGKGWADLKMAWTSDLSYAELNIPQAITVGSGGVIWSCTHFLLDVPRLDWVDAAP